MARNPETGCHDVDHEPAFHKPGYYMTTIISPHSQLKPVISCLRQGNYIEAKTRLERIRKVDKFAELEESLRAAPGSTQQDEQEVRNLFETSRLLGLLVGYHGDHKQAVQILETAIELCESFTAARQHSLSSATMATIATRPGHQTQTEPGNSHTQQTPFVVIRHMICLALAKVFLWNGEYDKAYNIAMPTWQYFEKRFDIHQLTFEAAFITASILSHKFDKRALRMCSKTVNLTRIHLGVHHPLSIEVVGTLVDIFLWQCRYREAYQYTLLVANEVRESALEPSHPVALQQRAQLGEAKLGRGDFLDGKVALQAAYDAATVSPSERHDGQSPRLCRYLAKLARANYLLWNLEESAKQVSETLRSQAKIFEDGSIKASHDVGPMLRAIFSTNGGGFATPIAPHPDILESLDLYADILSRSDDISDGENHHLVLEILKFVYRIREDRLGSSNILTLGCGVNLAIELSKYNGGSLGSKSDTSFLYGVISLGEMSRRSGSAEHCDTAQIAPSSASYYDVMRNWAKSVRVRLRSPGASRGPRQEESQGTRLEPTLQVMFQKCAQLDINHVYTWKARIWIVLMESLAKDPNFRDEWNLSDYWPTLKKVYNPSHPLALESWTKLCVIDMNLGCHLFTYLDVDELLAQLRADNIREQKLMLSLHLENTIGTFYCSLKEYERGLPVLRQLQQYLETLLRSKETHVVEVRTALESFKDGVDRSYKQAVLLAEKVLAKESIARDTYIHNEQIDDAERVAGNVIGISKGLYGKEHVETFKARFSLAEILYSHTNDFGKRWEGYFVAEGVLDDVSGVMKRPVASELELRNGGRLDKDQVCESAPELETKTKGEPQIKNEDTEKLQHFFNDLKVEFNKWSVDIWKPLPTTATEGTESETEIKQPQDEPEGVAS